MRTKFQAPSAPDYHEQEFIRLIEKHYKCEKQSFAQLIFLTHKINESHHRRVRKMIEKYNNYRYIDIIPLGKIITHNGEYVLVRSNHELADKVRLQARYNMLCGIISYQSTIKILGEQLSHGQVTTYDLHRKTMSELINEANELEEVLKSIENN